MKLILDWYDQLPEPIRSQAIENYDGMYKGAEYLARAISLGFVWSKTDQGRQYWLDITLKSN